MRYKYEIWRNDKKITGIDEWKLWETRYTLEDTGTLLFLTPGQVRERIGWQIEKTKLNKRGYFVTQWEMCYQILRFVQYKNDLK